VGDIWHIGLAVPDLVRGMDDVGRAFDIGWRPIHERATTVQDEAGVPHDVVCRFTFSATAPFAIEIWQAIPGTPLATPDSGILHHIGYWVDDLQQEAERLEGNSYTCFMSGPSLAIHRGPGGLMLEPCDVQRDRPFLRDLFPIDSALYSEPDNSGAT
jgi:glyoxalase/bleomycin resistance protein/dioxygenase superfamily protein